MISRNGICYDLELSTYRHTIDDLTYVFSSKSHLDKFKKKLHENREKINLSLSNRFNVSICVNKISDYVLYRKIETRGFLIVTSKGIKICQKEKLVFNGNEVTIQD